MTDMFSFLLILLVSLFIGETTASAPSGPWDNYNYAPHSKIARPIGVRNVGGSTSNSHNLISASKKASLGGKGSFIVLDFGKEVGGLISMTFDSPEVNSSISLSFTESPMFINPLTSDDSTYPSANMSYDGTLEVYSPLPSGFWTQPADRLRGGFRFLTVVSTSDAAVTISNISCSISFMPHVTDLRNYSGYFYTFDPVFHDKNFLTKLWYAGAYTVQTNTVSLNTGREVPFVQSPGWENNATLGVAGPIIVDGAKRDRAVWPGDMGIAVPTQFVSTNDLIPTRNALSTMFSAMDPITGALPESGPPLSQTGSDTYHAWTLIGTHNYFLYSGDTDWLQNVWANYTKAVQFLENKVTPLGLMNVTGLRDWARLGGGGINAEGNALLYKVLTNSADLASYVKDISLQTIWTQNATNLKSKFNEVFWVESLGMYRDNDTTTLCPQDANSFAVVFNLTDAAQARSISAGLLKNWNDLGPIAPELPDTITPFISGFELQAHFIAGNDDYAMDLLRRLWGYVLYTDLSVQSTLLEGFTANGSLSYRSYRGYNYDPSYTSHAHGWSSGPTSALSFYVLGLQITSPVGKTWTLAPYFSGLASAEGGYETPLGWFGVKWSTSGTTTTITVSTPGSTQGLVTLPRGNILTVDNKKLPNGLSTIAVSGGIHKITVRD